MYPSPTSVRESSPLSLVSLRAAKSMLYLLSSWATRAVLLLGLFGFASSSSRVRMFQVATWSFLIFLVLWLQKGGCPEGPQLDQPGDGSRRFLEPPFLGSFPDRVSSAGAAQTRRKLPRLSAASPQTTATITPTSPTCRAETGHFQLHPQPVPTALTPSPQDLKTMMMR